MGTVVSQFREQTKKYLNHTNWGASLAVTLNLKQSRKVHLKNATATYIRLTNDDITQNVRHFLNLLNASVYGNHWRRWNRQIERFVIVEKSNREHIHSIIKIPEQTKITELAKLIPQLWIKTNWGYGNGDIQKCYDSDGWIDYLLKYRTKSNLPDSIDWENTYLQCEI